MKKYLIPILATLTVECGGTNVQVTNGKDAGLEQELQQRIVGSKECDRVYWTSLPLEKKNNLLLVCDENIDGRYRRKTSLNLDNICDVYLKENSQWYTAPIDWLWGNDVVVKTKEGTVYSLRFWDRQAQEIYDILNRYTQKNVSPEEVLQCQK